MERIKQRAKNKFNISVAERPTDKWKTCELSFVYVNYTKNRVGEMIQRILEFMRWNNGIHILQEEWEIF